MWPHNPATGFWPTSATLVSTEPFSHGTGILRWLQKETLVTYRHWSVSLWQDPDDVPHCQLMSSNKTEWRLVPAELCRWRRCFLADQLWGDMHTRRRSDRKLAETCCKLSTVVGDSTHSVRHYFHITVNNLCNSYKNSTILQLFPWLFYD